MAFVESIGNIYKVAELRKKVLFTFAILFVYRIGAWITIPGVNMAEVQRISHETGGGLLNFISVLTGGALSNCTVIALGIMPYISASIIFQLLVKVIPSLEALSKEGEAGRRKINQYTRYATVGLCFIQSFFIVRWMLGQPGLVVFQSTSLFVLYAMLVLTTGTIFLMWLGEQVNEFGIGNGISLIIMAGIIARMPSAFINFFQNIMNAEKQGGNMYQEIFRLGMFLAIFFLIVIGVVIITLGQRRVPIQHQKQARGHRIYGGQRNFLPIRVNSSGVMPIIFAQSLLMIPTAIIGAFYHPINSIFRSGSFWYITVYCVLIFFFTYFWTAITLDPVSIAKNMKEHGSFIPGIRPGMKTSEHLEYVLNRITLADATFLSLIAIIPTIFASILGIERYITSFLGGTGILIVVGVALDMVQKVESHLLMRQYEGFMKKPIRGRRGY
jgi:preprotein translocase subunit SecY